MSKVLNDPLAMTAVGAVLTAGLGWHFRDTALVGKIVNTSLPVFRYGVFFVACKEVISYAIFQSVVKYRVRKYSYKEELFYFGLFLTLQYTTLKSLSLLRDNYGINYAPIYIILCPTIDSVLFYHAAYVPYSKFYNQNAKLQLQDFNPLSWV